MRCILLLTALVGMMLAPLQGWAQLPRFNPNDVLRADQLNAIVDRLETLGGTDGTPPSMTVDCANGTIGQALEQAIPGTTIQVTGTCEETVLITKDGITLDGQDATTIDGGNAEQGAVVTVDGARRVIIQGVSVRNGFDGILVQRGATVSLLNVAVDDNAARGITIQDNATVQLTNCTAQNNGDDGIGLTRSASAIFRGTIMSTNNGGQADTLSNDGIVISANSQALFDAATVTASGNGRVGTVGGRGISINGTSHVAFAAGSTVTANDNGLDGIRVADSSSLTAVDLATPITTSENSDRGVEVIHTSTFFLNRSTLNAATNGSDGIGVFQSSVLRINDAPAAMTTSGNSDRGAEVADTSTLILSNSRLDTTSNTGDGIGVFGSSRLSLTNASTVVSDTNNIGVNLDNASSIFGADDTTLTVQNNRSTGLSLARSAAANLNGTTTVANNGTQTASSGISLTGSNANLNGTTTVQDNTDFGILVNRVSGLAVTGTLNILSNDDHGVLVLEGSALRLLDGTMVIAENTGTGISVLRNAEARLARNTGTFSIEIRNNTTHGIVVDQHSFARLETGTVIRDNADDGLQVRRNSGIVVTRTSNTDLTAATITANGGNGIDVDDSTVDVNNATISNNAAGDVTATFGSRLTLNNNTIGTAIACDDSVLSRPALCP